MNPCPWYISAAALHDYMEIGGYHPAEDPEALRRLLDLCSSDAPRDTGVRTKSGAEIWRTGRVVVGRRQGATRLELTVMPGPRPEGELPQLLRVRAK